MHHLIVNRQKLTRRNMRKLAEVEKIFKTAGIDYALHVTDYKGESCEIVTKLTSANEKCSIIVLGGDGSLHDILNGINDFDNTSLGLIPFGTGNDFAACAHIPNNTKKAAEIIVRGSTRKIDFIELASGLRSLNAVGMGIDVDVLKRVYNGKNTKKSKYLRAFIVSLAKYKSCKFTVKYDGKVEEHFGLICGISNGTQIGGGIKLYPEAKIDDGYLDLVMVDYISKISTVSAFIKLMRGKVNRVKQITAVKVKQAQIVAHGETAIQADGEIYQNTPLDVMVDESKVNFYFP